MSLLTSNFRDNRHSNISKTAQKKTKQDYKISGLLASDPGIQIERVQKPDVAIRWDDKKDFFKAGLTSLEQRIAMMEDHPDVKAVPFFVNNRFETDTTLLSIDPLSGFVGISTSCPDAKLEVRSSGETEVLRVKTSTNLTSFLVSNDRKIGIGTDYLDATLVLVGDGGDSILNIRNSSQQTALYVSNTNNFVGIGSAVPSSVLDIQSVTSALRLSRVTSEERSKIPPLDGMMLFDTNLDQIFFASKNTWNSLGGTKETRETKETVVSGLGNSIIKTASIDKNTTSPSTTLHLNHNSDPVTTTIQTASMGDVVVLRIYSSHQVQSGPQSSWYIGMDKGDNSITPLTLAFKTNDRVLLDHKDKVSVTELLLHSIQSTPDPPTFSEAVYIETSTANSSPILELESTSKSLRLPNVDGEQKKAIPDPENGLLVYDTSLSTLSVNTSNGWINVLSYVISQLFYPGVMSVFVTSTSTFYRLDMGDANTWKVIGSSLFTNDNSTRYSTFRYVGQNPNNNLCKMTISCAISCSVSLQAIQMHVTKGSSFDCSSLIPGSTMNTNLVNGNHYSNLSYSFLTEIAQNDVFTILVSNTTSANSILSFNNLSILCELMA